LTAVIRDRKGKPSVAALPTNLLVGTLHNLQLFSHQALELAVKLIASGWELQSSLVEANSQRLSSFVVGWFQLLEGDLMVVLGVEDCANCYIVKHIFLEDPFRS